MWAAAFARRAAAPRYARAASGLEWYSCELRSRRKAPAFRDFTGMELVFLGTSAGGPTVLRSASSVALRVAAHASESSTWLFDVGEGTYRQLLSSSVSHAAVEKVFITHLHGDHLWGLPGLLVSCLFDAADSAGGRRRDLRVFGPEGTYDYLATTLRHSEVAPPRDRRVVVTELVGPRGRRRAAPARPDRTLALETIAPGPDGSHLVAADGTHVVRARKIRHGNVECFGYVVEEVAGKRRVDAAAATARGLGPGPAYQALQRGEDVVLPDGGVVFAKDVTSPPPPPRKVAILGDTSDASDAVDLAFRADVVVHEATMADDEARTAARYGHSTPKGAGDFAKACDAAALVLTHFSPRYMFGQSTHPRHARSDKLTTDVLLDQAKKSFGSDNVLAACDFMTLPVPRGGFRGGGGDDEAQG